MTKQSILEVKEKILSISKRLAVAEGKILLIKEEVMVISFAVAAAEEKYLEKEFMSQKFRNKRFQVNLSSEVNIMHNTYTSIKFFNLLCLSFTAQQ